MPVLISDDLIQASHLTENEIKIELAVLLFQKNRLTLGQACSLAETGRFEFQHILAGRKIPLHYDSADYFEDVNTLKQMGRQ